MDTRDLSPDPRILFVHIPKTGGEALYAALQEWAGSGRTHRFSFADEAELAEYYGPSFDIDHLRVLAGHLSYPGFMKKGLVGWSPVTIVREPASLFRSHYDYVRRTSWHPWNARVSAETLAEYVGREAHGRNMQCRQIAGDPPSAERAYEVLEGEFLLAAALEDIDRLVAALSAHIHFQLRLERVNTADRPPDPIDAETLAAIADQNIEDAALYRLIRERGLVGTGALPGP